MTQNLDNLDDATLVVQVLAGEQEAFTALLLRHGPSVLRMCRRILGPRPEAQDVAQEAALQSFLGLAHLQEPARFGAWFHATAANLARMVLRRDRILSLDAFQDDVARIVLWTEDSQTPEDVIAVRETHDAIVAALNELSFVNREVVIGFFLDGYSYQELAEILGVPVSTIRGRLFQGRQQLQRALLPLIHDVGLTMRGPRLRTSKEIPVEQPTLVELEYDGYRTFALYTDAMVVLRENSGVREMLIRIGRDDIALLQDASDKRPHSGGITGARLEITPPTLTAELILRLVGSLGGKVQRVVLHKLAENTYSATITLTDEGQTTDLDVRVTQALALAIAAEAPIYIALSVFSSLSFAVDAWEQDPASKEDFKERLAQRVRAETGVPVPVPLSPDVKAQIDSALARLLANVGATGIILRHRTGGLISHKGAGNEAELEHYGKLLSLQDQNPSDVHELVRYSELVRDEIFGADTPKHLFPIGREWRGQFWGHQDTDGSAMEFSIFQAMHELAEALSINA